MTSSQSRLMWTFLCVMTVLAFYGRGNSRPDSKNPILICIDTVRAGFFLHPGIHDELSPWLEQAQKYQAATRICRMTNMTRMMRGFSDRKLISD